MIRILYFFTCLFPFCSFAQINVSGTVYTSSGDPVGSAHLSFDSLQVIANDRGEFSLNLDLPRAYRLQVSAIGYADLEETIFVNADTSLHLKLKPVIYDLDVVSLSSSWIKPGQPFTFTELSKDDLKENNNGRDVPYLLQSMPSVVVTSDAGTGIGYTGIRIRGSDPSRINVTIDGIPVNDAESQTVFWVDLPDLASNAATMQVQRGVGTSTNGAGAFGGTINVETMGIRSEPFARIDMTAGSFSTFRANATFGTGLLSNRLAIQGSLSKIQSDGYIDRAKSDLRSAYLSATYLDQKQSIKFNLLMGDEKTYQAWNGVPAQFIDQIDSRTYNTAGLKSDGSFHDNEVDDYGQTHMHLIYKNTANDKLNFQTALHYTHGQGFFEQFRIEDNLSDYGLSSNATSSDLIRRRWLDNDFFGMTFNLRLRPVPNSDFTLGGGINRYLGNHFGEVIWTEVMPVETPADYYRNEAVKDDGNLFGQWQQTLSKSLRLFTDFQWRFISYEFEGIGSDLQNATQKVIHNFINPKAGLHFARGRLKGYYSVAVAHREPNRDDYVESSIVSRPKPERLVDQELGIQYNESRFESSLNFFHMSYKDQLVLSGTINDVGAYTRINVPQSSRLGVEYTLAWQLTPRFRFSGNTTWNRSRITKLTEAIDDWDTGDQVLLEHRSVPISFSPEWIAYGKAEYLVTINERGKLKGMVEHKYVGNQYMDNTGNPGALLDAYNQTDFSMIYTLLFREKITLDLKCQVLNVLNNKIISNGWIYRYLSQSYDGTNDDPHTVAEGDSLYTLRGYYPQAGRHALISVSLSF